MLSARKVFAVMAMALSAVAVPAQQKGNLQRGDYGYLYCHMNDREIGRAHV